MIVYQIPRPPAGEKAADYTVIELRVLRLDKSGRRQASIEVFEKSLPRFIVVRSNSSILDIKNKLWNDGFNKLFNEEWTEDDLHENFIFHLINNLPKRRVGLYSTQ